MILLFIIIVIALGGCSSVPPQRAWTPQEIQQEREYRKLTPKQQYEWVQSQKRQPNTAAAEAWVNSLPAQQQPTPTTDQSWMTPQRTPPAHGGQYMFVNGQLVWVGY